jgi:hypothetical protein
MSPVNNNREIGLRSTIKISNYKPIKTEKKTIPVKGRGGP